MAFYFPIPDTRRPLRVGRPGTPFNRNEITNYDLVHWWLGLPGWSSGAVARDLTRRVNGDLISSPAWTPTGRGDFGLTFTGSQYVDLDDLAATLQNQTQGTISVWFRISSSLTEHAVIFAASDATDPSSDLSIVVYEASPNVFQLRFIVREAGSSSLYANIGANDEFNDGEWHHLVVSVGGFGNRYYVDGMAPSVTYNNGNAATQAWFSDVNGIDEVQLAVRVDSGDTELFFKGGIADFLIANRPWTAAEALRRYNDARRGYPRALKRELWVSVAAAAGVVAIPYYYEHLLAGSA